MVYYFEFWDFFTLQSFAGPLVQYLISSRLKIPATYILKPYDAQYMVLPMAKLHEISLTLKLRDTSYEVLFYFRIFQEVVAFGHNKIISSLRLL